MHSRANNVGGGRIGASYALWLRLAGCHNTFVCSRENQEQDSEEKSPTGEQLERRKLARPW